MDPKICRVCLASNVRMHSIEDIGLLEIYENITNTRLYTEDGRPVTICYICCSQLQRCRTFCQMSRRAEQMLTDIVNSGMKITQKTTNKLNLETVPNLAIASVIVYSLNGLSINTSTSEAVKKKYNKDENTLITDIETKNMWDIEHSESISEAANKIYNKDENRLITDIETQNMWDIEYLESTSEAAKKKYNKDENRLSNDIETQNMWDIEHSESKDNIETAKALDTEQFGNKYGIILNTYCCDVCSKIFMSYRDMVKHFRSHEIKTYACDCCNERFTQRNYLQRHMAVHPELKSPPNDIKKPFLCHTCSKVFSKGSDLKKHIRTHTGEKPYICDVCKKAFSRSHDLKVHMRIHTENRNYICNTCNKTFPTRPSRQLHLKDQCGLSNIGKPYACNKCKKIFSTRSCLQRHMKIHTGVKLYACNQCNMAFFQSGCLKRHMIIHTKTAPQQPKITGRRCTCNICNNKTGPLSTLKNTPYNTHWRKAIFLQHMK